MASVWVDFNDASAGRVWTLQKFASRPLVVGDSVTARDSDENRCAATVESVSDAGLIRLRLAVDEFRPHA